MPSTRETALLALQAALTPLASATRTVEKNVELPLKCPVDGAIIVRDGNAPEEPEETYLASPPVYAYAEPVRVEAIVQKPGDAERDAALDVLCGLIGQRLALDRTLGGAVEWAEVQPAQKMDVKVEGGQGLKGASIAVVLHYTATDPLN